MNELACKLSSKEKEFLDLRNAHAKLQKVFFSTFNSFFLEI